MHGYLKNLDLKTELTGIYVEFYKKQLSIVNRSVRVQLLMSGLYHITWWSISLFPPTQPKPNTNSYSLLYWTPLANFRCSWAPISCIPDGVAPLLGPPLAPSAAFVFPSNFLNRDIFLFSCFTQQQSSLTEIQK